MRFLDVTQLSWERGDAHLANERLPKSSNVSDCSHYCSEVTDAWSLLMQHALCNGDAFEFTGAECDTPSLKSVAGRSMHPAELASVKARYSTVAADKACPGMPRSDEDVGGAGERA